MTHRGDPNDHRRSNPYIEIIAHNNSGENVYVDKLLVNGVEYTKTTIDRNVLIGQFGVGTDMTKVPMQDAARDPLKNPPRGVTLEFFMSATPKSSLCPGY